MRKFLLFVAVVITAAITLGSLVSLDHRPIPQVQISDKLVHIMGYAVLTGSWLLAFKHRERNQKFYLSIGISVFIYGIVIEALQATLTDYRQADWYDMIANLIGILVAISFFNIFFRKKKMN